MADLAQTAATALDAATTAATATDATAATAVDAGTAPTATDTTSATAAAATALDAAGSASEAGEVEDLFADYESDLEARAAAGAEQKVDEDPQRSTVEEELEKLLEEEEAAAEGAEAEKPQTSVEEELEKILLEEEAEAAEAEAAPPEPSQEDVPEVASTPQKASPQQETPKKTSPTKDDFVDETCYTQDVDGKMLLKWKIDYASRGGGGRAMCRDPDCLMRHEQAGVRSIEKGELRIGRRVLLEKEGADSQLVIFWYHARCIFNSFLRARKNTRTIRAPDEIEGFADIEPADQELLKNIIAGNQDVRTAKARTTTRSTPAKRGVPEDIETPMTKRLREDLREIKRAPLRKGDRVWTHCRVRPPVPEGAPAGARLEVAIKSPKPELGMLVEEPQDGCVIVQFESAEHEKERLEKYSARRRIRAWNRYPRIFEGKKQRIPVTWIKNDRPPPRLCGCSKQSWSHYCECGIACTRGVTSKVFGVSQLSEREWQGDGAAPRSGEQRVGGQNEVWPGT